MRAQHADMPLLQSKLVPPAAPHALVDRPRLAAELDRGVRGPVTLVHAPAGWGKTVLLGRWADGRAAWLSVEPGDATAFWAYVHAALCPALDPPPAVARRAWLAHLARELARRTEPAVLVLDDLHRVPDPAVLAGLAFLLRHAGAGLRLVVGARTEPVLPLHRWRLSGELTEVRADALAFTVDETARLLTAHGLAPSPAELAELHDRTEGWPAGLRLAALSGPGGDAIAGYVNDEVLAGLPADLREPLRCAALAESLCADLLDALTGRADGERLLAALRATGFVAPVVGRPGAYRMHRMFREVLQAELRARPEPVTELHRRAAAWHVAGGHPREALRHALAAGDHTTATTVFLEHWPDLLQDGHGNPTIPPPPPPPGGVAWTEERRERSDQSDEGRPHRKSPGPAPAEAGARITAPAPAEAGAIITAIRLAEAVRRDDPDRILEPARRLLALATDHAGGRALALGALGAARLATGDLAAAEVALARGLAEAGGPGAGCTGPAAASRLALVRALRGELEAAERTAAAVLGAPPCHGQDRPRHRAHAHLALALAHLHRDRPAEAEVALADADAARAAGTTDRALATHLLLVRVRLLSDRGDLAEGHRVLRAGRRELGDGLPTALDHALLATEADLRTAHGEARAAREMLAALPADAAGPVPVALARAQLAAGDPTAALRTLPGWRAPGPPVPLRLDAGLLEALAARRAGDDRRATRTLEEVLRLGEPEGFRRPFTRGGPAVRELLAGHLDSGTAYWFWVSELVGAGPAGPAAPGLDEPLTDRELTVLRYLQSILSTVEIATELCLSVNTVKTHVRNIYRKLATSRRRDAVRRARELRLL